MCPYPLHPYVGPADILAAVRRDSRGRPFEPSAVREGEVYTFVVTVEGVLRLAPRRSEHVACAGGAPVLGAGEITLVRAGGHWVAEEITNQSTGYCPDAEMSWPAVAAALEAAAVVHSGGFTSAFTFRWCDGCGALNVVREQYYVCAMCDLDLPRRPVAQPHPCTISDSPAANPPPSSTR
ncbi:hypothetical protein ACIOEW_20830 [Streptomyces sp. NPDC087901]|uniref:hypothetical protein n=1 Tax=Streptomyces sp. NPDC087901 TaxID=3365818 RepID=UPI00382402F8